MSAEFDITVTPQAMRNYRFYHKYTKFSGILELVLGVFLMVLCGFTVGRTEISYTLIVGFVGLFFLVIMPVGMAVRAGKTVRNSPRFQVPTHYYISDEKMVVSMKLPEGCDAKEDAENDGGKDDGATENGGKKDSEAESGGVQKNGCMSATVNWDEIYCVKETKVSILVYFTPVNANILPKEQLGSQLDTVKQIFKDKMNPYVVKLK